MSYNATEKDFSTLESLAGLWMKANEEIFTTILNRSLLLEKSEIMEKPVGEETSLLKDDNFLIFPITISSGILGNFYLVFSRDDLAIMIDLIIGGDGSSPMKEFDELHYSVLEEAISQIAGTLQSILSDNLMRSVNVKLGKPDATLKKLIKHWDMICLDYSVNIESVSEGHLEVLIPSDFTQDLVGQIDEVSNQSSGFSCQISPEKSSKGQTQGGTSMYRKAMFPQVGDGNTQSGKPPKMDLILDIPLELTVVLGKTGINVKELLEMGPGSILELEKLAGEPVEIFVNDRLVGYGEVIVIEENFGVRVISVVEGSAAEVGGNR